MFPLAREFSSAPAGYVGDETRFVRLWNHTVMGAAVSATTAFRQLVQLYGAPERHYHSFEHIRRCLDILDRMVTGLDNPDTVEMALWFHDAIYILDAQDNERRSADLFGQWTQGCADSAFCYRVDHLIMMTTHRVHPHQQDERFIMDIDLASFGLPWAQFERDGGALRAECAAMSDEEYYPRLLQFLRYLQNRPTVFFTDYFQQHHEPTARSNIQRLVGDLRARGYGGV